MGTVPVDPGELSEAPDNVKELLDQRRGVGEVIKDQLLPQHVKSVGRGSFAGVFKIKMGGVNMVGTLAAFLSASTPHGGHAALDSPRTP